MKGPYVILRPTRCKGRGLNKFYRILLQDLPKNHHSRPGVKVSLKSLPHVLDAIYKPRKWRSK